MGFLFPIRTEHGGQAMFQLQHVRAPARSVPRKNEVWKVYWRPKPETAKARTLPIVRLALDSIGGLVRSANAASNTRDLQ